MRLKRGFEEVTAVLQGCFEERGLKGCFGVSFEERLNCEWFFNVFCMFKGVDTHGFKVLSSLVLPEQFRFYNNFKGLMWFRKSGDERQLQYSELWLPKGSKEEDE